jgi:hypothetical protein
MASIWYAQLDPTTIFLTQLVHKETWVGLAIKLWGFTSCVGVNSSVKHTRARKYPHKHENIFLRGFT